MRKAYIFLLIICTLEADFGTISNMGLNSSFDRVKKDTTHILKRSKKTRQISEEFGKVAEKHKRLYKNYIYQKSVCKNLEDVFQYTKSHSNQVFTIKKNRLIQCYTNLNSININYALMNKDFMKLEKKINILLTMTRVEIAALPSLRKQLDIIKDMLYKDKIQLESKKKSLQYIKY